MRIYLLAKSGPQENLVYLNGNPTQEYYIYLKYENLEWPNLEALYRSHNLRIAKTDHGFGFLKIRYYQYANNDDTLLRYAIESGNERQMREISNVDDINREAIVDGKINLAVFRVIPGKSGLVKIRIPRMINLVEEKEYTVAFIKAYGLLFNATVNVEIHILGRLE
jgi:hypothetical protein